MTLNSNIPVEGERPPDFYYSAFGKGGTHRTSLKPTPRQLEILGLVAEGNSNKVIAHAIGISRTTVTNHMVVIMSKLGADDRTHAVVLAIRKGWLQIAKEG